MVTLIRKPWLYLDTSVLNAYFDDTHPDRQTETVSFWDRLGSYQPHISGVVFRELLRTRDVQRRAGLVSLVIGIPKLRVTGEAVELAHLYVAEAIVPEEYTDDALHIAIATVQGVDYVVSWNFEHLVNVRVRRSINWANTKCGYRELEIVAPVEL